MNPPVWRNLGSVVSASITNTLISHKILVLEYTADDELPASFSLLNTLIGQHFSCRLRFSSSMRNIYYVNAPGILLFRYGPAILDHIPVAEPP